MKFKLISLIALLFASTNAYSAEITSADVYKAFKGHSKQLVDKSTSYTYYADYISFKLLDSEDTLANAQAIAKIAKAELSGRIPELKTWQIKIDVNTAQELLQLFDTINNNDIVHYVIVDRVDIFD